MKSPIDSHTSRATKTTKFNRISDHRNAGHVLPFGITLTSVFMASHHHYFALLYFCPRNTEKMKNSNVHWMIAHVMIQSIRLLISHSHRKVVIRQFCVSKTDKSSFVHILAEKMRQCKKRQWKRKRNYRSAPRIHTHVRNFKKRGEWTTNKILEVKMDIHKFI